MSRKEHRRINARPGSLEYSAGPLVIFTSVPTARSFQPRALVVVDRTSAVPGQLGDITFALTWLDMLTPELGNDRAMDILTSGDEAVTVASDHQLVPARASGR